MPPSRLSAYQLIQQLEAVLREGQELTPEASRCLQQVTRHLKGIVSALETYLASVEQAGRPRP